MRLPTNVHHTSTFLIQYRLVYQVQCCSNTAKFLAVRIGGMENVVLEDNETTFEQLYARIERTVQILESLDPHCMDGAETKEIILETSFGKFQFGGQEYVTMFAIPFFHFHLSTAYCVIRKMGVEIGALDYMKDVFHRVEE